MRDGSVRTTGRTRLNGAPLLCAAATLFAASSLSGGSLLGAAAAQEHQHPTAAAPHRHPEAATIQNPVPADPASTAAGRELYAQHCSDCHGETGKGDGMMGEELDPKPSNLTDATWKHGSSDGEIFAVVRDGVKGTGMKPFGKKLTAHQMWDLVNYIRSIGPAPAKHH